MESLVKRGLSVAALLVCLAAVASAQAPAARSQDPVAGSRAFGAKGCVACHSIKGLGGKIGPDLGRTERPRSFYDLAAALWNHAPRMADRMRQAGVTRPRLEARESEDLVAFLFTIDYFDRPGDAQAGRRLFSQKRCIACHQVGGSGGVIGPNLDTLKQQATPIYLASALWNHGPQMADMMRRQRIQRPTFKGSELRDLSAYLVAAAPAEASDDPLYVLPGDAESGRQLFTAKRCIQCHSAGGQGGKVGPDLVERRAGGSVLDFAAAMWNKAPAMTSNMKRRGVAPPQLSAAEMADIVAYLYSVRYLGPGGDARKGAAVAAAKGCTACHVRGGEPGKPAIDLARAKVDSPGAALAALWNHAFLDDGRPVRDRTSWAAMSGEEMRDLMTFLQSAR
jgi:mono/diheme cytochrome c family protein